MPDPDQCVSENLRVMRSPKTVELGITSRCNLRCSYCSHFSSAGDVNTDLSASEWQQFFRELGENAVLDVVFSGGEPFIREDIKELISGVVANRMRFSFLSNATLITEDLAAFIRDTGRCDRIQVSIDGPGPETHDFFRGDGSFVKALEGLKTLLKYQISPSVRVTVQKKNLNSLDEAAKLLLEDVGLSGFSTNAASYMGLCRKNEGMVQLNPAEYSQAMATLLRLNKKYDNRIIAQAGPLASANQWLEMTGAREAGKPGLPGCGFLRSCGGVFQSLSVRADGVMVPCSHLGHIALGRINQDRLADVWMNHPELQRLRERRNTPLSDFAFCQGCEYIPFCRGGCPALAFSLTGDDNTPSPESCLKRFLAGGGKLPETETEGKDD